MAYKRKDKEFGTRTEKMEIRMSSYLRDLVHLASCEKNQTDSAWAREVLEKAAHKELV